MESSGEIEVTEPNGQPVFSSDELFARPGRLRILWWRIVEFYYTIFRYRFFVLKQKVKFTDEKAPDGTTLAGEIQWTRYLSIKNKEFYWDDTPKPETAIGWKFIWGALMRKFYMKRETDSSIEYRLAMVGDIAFIREVTGEN